jgi:thymidylate synthase
MRIIAAPSLGRAHELAVKMVLEKGWTLVTENNEATIEFEEMGIRVETPFTEPMASPSSRFQRRFLEKYAEDLLNGSAAQFEYDYHSRLFDWGQGLVRSGKEIHADQICYLTRKLASSPVSRRAVAVTWNPPVDEELDDCPCLQLVQGVVRGGALHLKVVFRSNDMLSALGANMFALAHLQKSVAGRLGLPCGSYTHISLVPHVYYQRDLNELEAFCRKGSEIRPVDVVCRACGRCPHGAGGR